MGSGRHPREEQALPSLPLSAPSRQSLQRPGEARRRFQQRLLRLEPQFLPLLVWVLLPVLLLPVSVREGSSVRLLLPVLLTGLIITGRCKSRPAYFDLASVHSEMVCHKHYAERGVDLKRGVDY